MMVSFETWVETLSARLGVGEVEGSLTRSAARSLWLREVGDVESTPETTATLDAAVDWHVRCAVATQKLVRGKRVAPRPCLPARPRDYEVLAPYNPTPDAAIAAALDLLHVTPEDVLYDVGCGDGRFLVAAATAGARRVVGVEADGALAARATANTRHRGDQVDVLRADALSVDMSDASKLFLYLLPSGLAALKDRGSLELLRHHADVVSYTFAVPGWRPRSVTRPGVSKATTTVIPPLYFYPKYEQDADDDRTAPHRTAA